jgi:hypothetical protein
LGKYWKTVSEISEKDLPEDISTTFLSASVELPRRPAWRDVQIRQASNGA